jgi:hypothetical protein
MFTSQQAEDVVRQSILAVTGSVGRFGPRLRLQSCGIDTAAKLKRLKVAMVTFAAREGRKMSLHDLSFDRDATVGSVNKLILSVRPPKKISLKKTAKKAPNRANTKKAVTERPAAKKSSVKKAAKKAPARAAKPVSSLAKKAAPKKSKPQQSSAGIKTPAKKVVRVGVPRRRKWDIDEVKFLSPVEGSVLAELPGDPTTAPGGGGGNGGANGGAPMAAPPDDGGANGGVEYEAEEGRFGESAPDFTTTEPPQLPAKTVECTPQLEIRRELQPKVYQMAVWVDQQSAAPGADVQTIEVTVPQSTRSFDLDVWLDRSSHFDLKTDGPPTLTVDADKGVSDPLNCTVTVLHTAHDRPMYVSAFFRYQGRPCGKITRFFEFRNGVLTPTKIAAPPKSEGEVVLPLSDAPPSVSVNTVAQPADIRVEVLKTEANDGRQFTLKCHTPQGNWEGPWNLPQVSKELVNTYMKAFMASQNQARIASLKGAGMDFWKALPSNAQKILWDALEAGARTMSVVSEEPYIPWELMVPYRKVQDPRKPLGIDLLLGRWVTGDYTAAAQHVPMKSGYIICPKTSGLASSSKELTFLTQQLRPDFDPADEVSPATFVGVDTGLSGPPRNVIHFICHGKSALLQTLELDKPDTLDCSQVRALKGFQAAFQNRPLAFLNACEVGGLVLALDGIGGFANSFIELGASAVVAPLWPVQDTVALEVTQTFYTQALKGVPFADVMRTIRAKAYEEGVDSYAAYCFYGDPLASAGS